MLLLSAAVAGTAACNGTRESAPDEATGEPTALETIFSRKSVRKYTEEPVTEAQVETLLKAAMAAPSGMDRRPWRFVVIDNPETKAALGGQRMYTECSVLIVVCGETQMQGRDGNLRDNPNWTADCAAATENLLLAAEAMGLGAVWTACYPYEDRMNPAREVLNIPETVCPYAIVPVGHPDGETPVKNKWDPENIHYNRW